MSIGEHVDELLPEYALGLLTAESRAQVASHVAGCTSCRATLTELEAAMTVFATQAAPIAGLQRKLSASLEGPARFEHFVPELMTLFSLPEAACRDLLAALDDDAGWEEGPERGVGVKPVTPGAHFGDAFTALVRVEPGATFPMHEHMGEERVLVLEGGYVSEGVEMWRGDLDVRPKGTRHSFVALPGLPCLVAAVIRLAKD